MNDFNVEDYLKSQQEEIAARRQKTPTVLKKPGEEATIDTGVYGITHVDKDSVVTPSGVDDSILRGPRPQRPEEAIK